MFNNKLIKASLDNRFNLAVRGNMLSLCLEYPIACISCKRDIFVTRNKKKFVQSDLVTHRWAAHHCVGGSNPDACEKSRLASHAIYTLIQCTPLLVEKAGVAPEVNLRNPLCAGEEARKRWNPPWLWNPGQTSPKVQNRGISGPTKRTCVLQKFKKKKKKKINSIGSCP